MVEALELERVNYFLRIVEKLHSLFSGPCQICSPCRETLDTSYYKNSISLGKKREHLTLSLHIHT